jgi:hypothetical protein
MILPGTPDNLRDHERGSQEGSPFEAAVVLCGDQAGEGSPGSDQLVVVTGFGDPPRRRSPLIASLTEWPANARTCWTMAWISS